MDYLDMTQPYQNANRRNRAARRRAAQSHAIPVILKRHESARYYRAIARYLDADSSLKSELLRASHYARH